MSVATVLRVRMADVLLFVGFHRQMMTPNLDVDGFSGN